MVWPKSVELHIRRLQNADIYCSPTTPVLLRSVYAQYCFEAYSHFDTLMITYL